MFKYFAAFRKEWLILIRDFAGLIVLFIMPTIMVVILALVQEFGWNSIKMEPQFPVLFVNNDHDSLGSQFEHGLNSSRLFKVVTAVDSVPLTQEVVRKMVLRGESEIGIIVPEGSTEKMRTKAGLMVNQIMGGLMNPGKNLLSGIRYNDSVSVIVYFDPAVKTSFKIAFMSSLKEFSSAIELKMVFSSFNTELGKIFPNYQAPESDYKKSVVFSEVFPSGKEQITYPTTTQHNVPAWAIFAMFFIVIPMTGSMIKEREEGSAVRLLSMPVSYSTIFMAKVGVYLIVCVVQFIMMLLAGIYVLPLFGMPTLVMGTHYFAIAMLTIMTSLSALGFAIAVGTIAKTHQQASAFGSVSVVILTALGGLWVPIYLMPKFMSHIATYSPLNWSHAGFQDLFVREGTFIDIVPDLIKLFIFFVVTMAIAIIYRKFKPSIPN
jgi:ABC-2 type transport system permease protein